MTDLLGTLKHGRGMAKHELDADLVRKLAALLDETGLTELEYATQTLRVKVGRNNQMPSFTLPASSAPVGAPASAATPAAPAADHPGLVSSPMVGTVYMASEPGAAPFIQVGDTVKAGQTLLIIEAMKVMNPLTAPRAGKITQIMARDSQPVEFGEALLIIEG